MRDEVRETMHALEALSTKELAGRAKQANPFGGDYAKQSRTQLLNLNLRWEHAPLTPDEGWE